LVGGGGGPFINKHLEAYISFYIWWNGNVFGGAFYPYFWKRFWWGFLSILLETLLVGLFIHTFGYINPLFWKLFDGFLPYI